MDVYSREVLVGELRAGRLRLEDSGAADLGGECVSVGRVLFFAKRAGEIELRSCISGSVHSGAKQRSVCSGRFYVSSGSK